MSTSCAYFEPDGLVVLLKKHREVVIRIVKLLNDDRRAYRLTQDINFRGTRQAVKLLSWIFHRGPLSRIVPAAHNVDVIPHVFPYMVHGRAIKIRSASTNGHNIQFYYPGVMTDRFERMSTRFGKVPPGLTHYAVMILHEYGHIIHRAIRRTTNSEDILRSLTFLFGPLGVSRSQGLRCWKTYAKDFDAQSEWFADVFSRTFVRVALGSGVFPKRAMRERGKKK